MKDFQKLRWLLVIGLCLLPGAAAAQLPQTQGRPTLDPQALQQPLRAPITLTPSLTVSQEFNDNILLNNNDKRSDFITGFTPGLEFVAEPAAMYCESRRLLLIGSGQQRGER